MKIYIAGAITGIPDYKSKFEEAEKQLQSKGHKIMNPALLGNGFEQHEYMNICYSMIDVCDAVYFLNNWKGSKGANLEYEYAHKNNKIIQFQE